MTRIGVGPTLGAVIVCLGMLAPLQADGGTDVNLKAIQRIAIPAQAAPDLEALAKNLAGLLQEAYGLAVPVERGAPPDGESAILLDRALAVGSGLVSDQELEAVKPDGYVVRAAGGRIAAAGYRPLGTLYAVYGLLERLGSRVAPASGCRGGCLRRE